MDELPKMKGTILILETDTNALLFLSRLCQTMGFGTLTTTNGEEALKYSKECGDKIDIVLIDPADRVELVANLCKQRPKLPIMVLAASDSLKNDLEKLGIKAFIKKPYSLSELREKLEAVYEGREVGDEDALADSDMEPAAKIMIVDDEPEICTLMNELLYDDISNASFTVKWAKSGQEALRLSSEYEPDIAIVDMKMPGMSGAELIQRLKAGEGHCPRDFVVYTGFTDPQNMAQAQSLGHKVLTKPSDLDTLFKVLEKICVRHHLLKKSEEKS